MALVRVKRRASDDPIDVLLLACKKFKADEASPVATVFKFAATVSDQESDIKTHIDQAAVSQKQPLKYRQTEVTAITQRLRAENKLFSKDNRLKVVNCFRALESQHGGGALDDGDEGKRLTVVDIESEPSSTREAPKGSSSSEVPITEEQYVYDLYYSKMSDFDDMLMENVLSVHEVDEKLIFGDYVNKESDDDSNGCDDDDDSNDENNWRNDYPDEDDGDEKSSIDEEDMRLAMGMGNMCIDGEYQSDLSSDREDEALVYGIDDDKRNYYFHTTSDSDSDYQHSDID